METPNKHFGKPVTIYTSSTFGVLKLEGKIVDFGTKKYAQYDNAAYFHYVQKRKHNASGIIKGYKPYMIIIEGHNHVSPEDIFKVVSQKENIVVSKTKYSSFDDRYLTEFDECFAAYSEQNKFNVLMDIRFTINSNIINK